VHGLVVEGPEVLVVEAVNRAVERRNCGVSVDGVLVYAGQDVVVIDMPDTVIEVAAEVLAMHSCVVHVRVRAPSAKSCALVALREPLQDLLIREQRTHYKVRQKVVPDHNQQHLAAFDYLEEVIELGRTTGLNGTWTDLEVLYQVHVPSCPTIPESSAVGLVGVESPLTLWMAQCLVLTRLGCFEAVRREDHLVFLLEHPSMLDRQVPLD
jgi:hypothetical protein